VSAAANKNLIFIICAVTLGISAFLWFFIKENEESTIAPLTTSSH